MTGIRNSLLFSIILIAFSVSASESEKYHCPLTKEYLLIELRSLKSMVEKGVEEIPQRHHKHLMRMSGEILKSDDFSELRDEIQQEEKSCSYFWMAIHLQGIQSEYEEYWAAEKAKLLTHIDKCINWISKRFGKNEEVIDSWFCKTSRLTTGWRATANFAAPQPGR